MFLLCYNFNKDSFLELLQQHNCNSIDIIWNAQQKIELSVFANEIFYIIYSQFLQNYFEDFLKKCILDCSSFDHSLIVFVYIILFIFFYSVGICVPNVTCFKALTVHFLPQRQTKWTQKAERKAGGENHGSVQVLWPVTSAQVMSYRHGFRCFFGWAVTISL